MKSKQTAISQKQQKRILEAAKNCFLENGLAHTTMRDIATHADMSLGNIYRYFKNKEALIKAFIESDRQEIDEAFSHLENCKDFNSTLLHIGKEYIEDLSTQSELIIYIDLLSEALRDDSTLSLLSLEESEQALCKQLKMAVSDKRINLAISADLAATTLIAFIENAALKRIVKPEYSSRQAGKQFKQLVALIITQ